MRLTHKFMLTTGLTAALVIGASAPAFAHNVPKATMNANCQTVTAKFDSFPKGNHTFTLSGTIDSQNSQKLLHGSDSESGTAGTVTIDISQQTNNLGHLTLNPTITWTADTGGHTSITRVLTCGQPIRIPGALAVPHSGCSPEVSVTTGDGNTKTQLEFSIAGSLVPFFNEKVGPNQTRQVAVQFQSNALSSTTVSVDFRRDGKHVRFLSVSQPSDETCHPVKPKVTASWKPMCGGSDIIVDTLGGNTQSVVTVNSAKRGSMFNEKLSTPNEVKLHDELPNGGSDSITVRQDGKIVVPSFNVHSKSVAECTKATSPTPASPVQAQMPPTLPRTGSSTLPIGFVGFTIIAIGGGIGIEQALHLRRKQAAMVNE